MGGSGFDNVLSITPDDAGNVFVLGTTQSSDFPTTATFGSKAANGSNSGDTFVAKLRLADWSLIWSVVIRPSVPLALAVDRGGAVYLTGYTDSPANFPAPPGSLGATVSGPWSPLFVLKLDATGSRIIYSAFVAAYQLYTNAAIAVDGQGQAYFAAVGTAPVTSGVPFPAVSGGNSGGYFAKLSADGSRILLCTYLATTATVAPRAIAVDEQQNVFIAGGASGSNSSFPSTPGVVQPNFSGGRDAFVMKFSANGSKLEFATLLGGAGGDSAGFLRLGPDGSIYLAGECDYGNSSFTDAPFPTTANAPFRTFDLFQGFVARLSPDASTLLFSTHVSNSSSPGVSGLALAGGQVFAAYAITISRGFLGLNYYPTADFPSTAVQAFDAGTGAAETPALQIPAMKPDGFAIFGSKLVIASNDSQISLPVPTSIRPIGALDTTPNAHFDITVGEFDLAGVPDHDIATDHGYLYFEPAPGASIQQTLNVTSSAGSVPFRIFAPGNAVAAVSPHDGFTPSAVSVSSGIASPSGNPGLLIVSAGGIPSIQIVPVLTHSLPVQVSAQADTILLPADGGPSTGTINITALGVSQITQSSVPVSVPFQFDNPLPPILRLDTVKGTTPANVTVTAQIDSLRPGGTDVEQLGVTIAGQHKIFFLVISRPGPAPLVSPTSLQLSGTLRQSPLSGRLQITPADESTAFQAVSVPAGITVSPSSGTGAALLTVAADLSQFPAGLSRVTMMLQLGATQVPVTASVTLFDFPLSVGQGPLDVAPGLRLRIYANSIAVNFPQTGAWNETSPAPTDWNGYSFAYRSRSLPILSADPSTLQFDVQIPYDIDLTAHNAPIQLFAPDGTEISRSITYGAEIPAAVALFDAGRGPTPAFKTDGSAISSTNTVRPGDTIRLLVVGAGLTNPPIQTGILPDPSTTVSPVASIQVQIGGKTTTVVRRALDPYLIGVTDLDVLVPSLAPGLNMMGLQTGIERVDLIQVWIGN
jgi:uncharacterized protein (TIGR03437 family)